MKSKLEFDIESYKIFRSYIEHEDSLINQRTTWMFSIHGFLFAAYALVLQKKMEIMGLISNAVRGNGNMPPVDVQTYVKFANLDVSIIEANIFTMFITCIGLAVSWKCSQSVKAARRAAAGVVAAFFINFPVLQPQIKMQIERGVSEEEVLELVTHRLGGEEESLSVPTIVGGGVPDVHKMGERAPRAMPSIFIVGWMASFIFIIFDTYLNFDIVYYRIVSNFLLTLSAAYKCGFQACV